MDYVIGFAKLPVAVPLFTDVSGFLDGAWQPHFNTRDYDGGWDVLSLRSPGGRADIFPALIGGDEYADTPYMDKLPSVKQLLNSLQCPVMSVRLLNLKAGAVIKQHRDKELAFEKGEARLHFPVQTNAQVEFYVNDIRVPMLPGEAWYINANMPHRVSNNGATDRVHLVIDCVVNNWLKAVFATAEKTSFAQPMDVAQTLRTIEALRDMKTDTGTQVADELEAKLQLQLNGQQ